MLEIQSGAEMARELANRWFQPLTHVSEAAFPRDCAGQRQQAKREKREEQRFLVAQFAAQSVHGMGTVMPTSPTSYGPAR